MMSQDDFELKRAMDALPREIEPPADLWPGIRAGLKTGDGRRETGDGSPKTGTRFRIAALLTLLAASAGTLALMRHNAGIWEVSTASLGARRLAVGDRFASGSDSARLTVGRIGTVDVAAGSDVRLLAARWSEHRLALNRGTIHAEVTAPPRLFIVETPSGTAVDMGCAYTLEVDSLGSSRLVVTAGWVEFSERGRTSLIPAGFRAEAGTASSIGVPFADDAPRELVAALRVFAGAGARDDAALATILRLARPRDAVTLWHLVQRTAGAPRDQVFQRLTQLVPPPAGITSAALRDDANMMKLYWTRLPGTLPIVPDWQEKLWRLWLRVAG